MHKQKILVIDDEPSITRLLKLNLELTGLYEVMEANNGVEAMTTAFGFGG